jgi:hypothetical protein
VIVEVSDIAVAVGMGLAAIASAAGIINAVANHRMAFMVRP